MVVSDSDDDGICDADDTCIGDLDACGECEGDGTSCGPVDVPVQISSSVDIRGIQFNLTGGGTFSYDPVLQGVDATGDVAPYVFASVYVLANGFALMTDFSGTALSATGYDTILPLITPINTGATSDICIDPSSLVVSDGAGNSILYASIDQTNCLLINVLDGAPPCTDTDSDGVCDDDEVIGVKILQRVIMMLAVES